MSCAEIEPELIGYHFGTSAPLVREQIEQHLPQCPKCVTSLLLLKRQLETQPEVPSPSQSARDKLRAAVAVEIGVAPWRWWERPVALASGAAAALLAVFVTWSVATGRVEVLTPPDNALASRAADPVVGSGAARAERARADQGRVRGRALHPERVRR